MSHMADGAKLTNRRDVLKKTAGIATLTGFAGCSGGGGSGSDGSGSGGGTTSQKTTVDQLETFENDVGSPVGANWEAVKELAKEEDGDWVQMSSTDSEDVKIWMEDFDWDFKENYKHVGGDSTKLIRRAIQEYKAGQSSLDFTVTSSGVFELANEDLAMELSEDLMPRYTDVDEKFTTKYMTGQRIKPGAIYYNPDQVEKDAISSWNDVVTDDRWQGKIGWDPTPNMTLIGSLLRTEGREFFKKLTNQDPQWTDSHPDLARFTASGKYPIAFTYGKYLAEYDRSNLRVMDQLAMPAAGSGCGVASFASNPNQSLVFANYLNSDAGQKLTAKTHISLKHGREGLSEAKDWKYGEVVTDQKASEEGKAVWDELGLGTSG